MIARLSGLLIEKTPPRIVIDVNGVGYEVMVPMSTFCNLPAEGQKVTLLTQFIVREDAQTLYGFASTNERLIFQALIKISGVGPRIALAVLSGLSPSELVNAVETDNSAMLVRVPGIGKKTAERLVLELKGKLLGVASPSSLPLGGAASDIMGALVALGYSEKEAQMACKSLPSDVSVNDGIRQALKLLAH